MWNDYHDENNELPKKKQVIILETDQVKNIIYCVMPIWSVFSELSTGNQKGERTLLYTSCHTSVLAYICDQSFWYQKA